MFEWLLSPIDPARAHDVGAALAWHGRLMVLGWGVLIPLGVVAARFLKVTPRQDWPHELDNRFWWRSHLTLQYAGGVCMAAGFILILAGGPGLAQAWLHRALGYCVLALGALQFLAGWLRGSKGGPSEQDMRGDHYDMTARRRIFEHVHRTFGYLAVGLAMAAVLTGLWAANAPLWMWIAIAGWWALLGAAFMRLQLLGWHVSSYHAIWGPDPAHPGNRKG
jgi:hypothetical protein